MPALLPVFIAASHLVLAAEDVPRLNVEPSCRAATMESRGHPGDRSAAACLQDEQVARGNLQKEWSTYSAADRERCLRLSDQGGMPSYVELLTCLQIAKQSGQLPAADRLNGLGGR